MVHVSGIVRYDAAPELRKRLLAQTGEDGAATVLELSGVQAIDTAGAAVLVEVWMAGRERGRHVVLCAPSPSVVELFRLGGFEQILHDCCPSPQAARDRLAGEGRRS